MGSEAADGRNGGPRSFQAFNPPLSLLPALVCQAKNARERAPLYPFEGFYIRF